MPKKSEKPATSEKPSKLEKRKKADKRAKDEKPEKPEKAVNAKRAAKGKKARKVAKAEKAAKAGNPDKARAVSTSDTASKPTPSDAGRSARPVPDAPAAALADVASEHAHGRVDDLEPTADFGRLVAEIAGLVELVHEHRPEVRRAVFDSYVTAVIEFGATARDLGFVDLREGDAVERDAPTERRASARDAGVAAGPRRRSFEEPPATPMPKGPVREAEGVERELAEPKAARSSVHRARSGMGVLDPEAESSKPIRRRRSAQRAAPDLAELAAAHPPRNNDQRNSLIVQAHELASTAATLEEIAADYERMGWRVPVNLAASLRQSMRNGLVLRGGDGGYLPA